jgi:prepilin-type N-terminal cleavage/methylation domain-containing protein
MTRRTEAGFTLLEVMVVCAIIAILAVIALPSFASQSRKAKGDSEVNAFMAELRVRQEQYQLEKGLYLSTGTSETDMFPAGLPTDQYRNLGTLPATWTALKFGAPATRALCTYVVQAGTPTTGTVGSVGASFGMIANTSKNWFYILARCNLDGASGTYSWYFLSNIDQKVQKLNHGK